MENTNMKKVAVYLYLFIGNPCDTKEIKEKYQKQREKIPTVRKWKNFM